METSNIQTVWEFLEKPHRFDRYVGEVQALYSWGLNCNREANPFLVFLDLIGWSKENFGADLVVRELGYLGYLELDYLADALKEYAQSPHEVTQWISELMQTEGV